MITPQYLDKISNELFEKHSLAALVICIEAGRELDFNYKNILYGITWIKGNEKVILIDTKSNETQEFKNIIDLVINGIIDNKRFIDIWEDVFLIQLL